MLVGNKRSTMTTHGKRFCEDHANSFLCNDRDVQVVLLGAEKCSLLGLASGVGVHGWRQLCTQFANLTSQELCVALLAVALAQARCVHRHERIVALTLENAEVCLDDSIRGGFGNRLAECAKEKHEVSKETNQWAEKPGH